MSAIETISALIKDETALYQLSIKDSCYRQAFVLKCEAAFEALWQEGNFKQLSVELTVQPSIGALSSRLLALLPKITFTKG